MPYNRIKVEIIPLAIITVYIDYNTPPMAYTGKNPSKNNFFTSELEKSRKILS